MHWFAVFVTCTKIILSCSNVVSSKVEKVMSRVSSWDVGTGNFPFFAFPDSREICVRILGKLLTFEQCCAAVVLTVNLFKLEHHCGKIGLVKCVLSKLCSSHLLLDTMA